MDKIITENFKETQALGQKLAGKILMAGIQKNAVALALQGDLGAGKTTFLQGFAKGLGIEEVVNSPTFVIMKKFEIPKSRRPSTFGDRRFFYHFDLYRLENEKDVEFLDIKEIIKNPENIVAIEWPEKIENILPKNSISIKFKHLKGDKRELTFEK